MRMVNVGFPEAGRVWFRNGGYAGATLDLAENRHQSKIYTESNHPDFSRVSGALTSMQTLAIIDDC
jgi:hypothetical protein